MADDSISRVRADFDALRAKLKASVDQLEPERYDQITARLVALDESVIHRQIERRRGSHRVEKLIREIESRLVRAEERARDRA